jgi:aminoglycoside N3'-acetyltransferase
MLKQLNVPAGSICMNIGTAAVGYGFEYVASTLDRIRDAALKQNDADLQMPIVAPVSTDTWGVKESSASEEDEPACGCQEERAIDMEVATAAANLTGGADAVIDGLLDALSPDGTLVFPTLVQKDFSTAYERWDKNVTPSDVGLITEVARKRKDAFRSDQATHSVSAIGKKAEFLTNSHSSFGPRMHPYGDFAFSHGSPWQKMYDLNAKVLFIGVGLESNTFHHFVEAIYSEKIISLLDGKPERQEIISKLVTFYTRDEHTRQLQEESKGGEKHTLIRFQFGKRRTLNRTFDSVEKKEGYCGQSRFLLFNVKEYVDGLLEELETHLDEFYTNDVLAWIERAKNL